MGLAELHAQIRKCRKCRLWKTRKHTVPGEGNPHAEMMFIGQAPGRYEDAGGRPFVGRAGKLLDEILAEAGLKRKDVFITSVLKCFPPKNRLPKKDEVESCKPYLLEQIKLISPKTIILLGNVAISTLLGKTGKLGEIHGREISKGGTTHVPTYHPAAAVRFPRLKTTILKDVRKALEK